MRSIRIIFGVLLVLAVYSCKEKKSSVVKEHYTSVTVSSPITKNVTLVNDYPGSLAADNSIPLIARVDGYITEVNYKPGQFVNKGAVLFVIEPTLYENSVNQAKGALESSQAELVYAENNYVRMLEASKSDAVSEIDVIQAKSNLDQAKAAVISDKAALKTAETNLSYCYVRAATQGRASVNLYTTGQYVNGSASPITLATVYDDRHVFVNFAVPESMLPTVKNLDSLAISFASDENGSKANYTETFAGKIDYVAPNVTLTTGTFAVRAKLKNRDDILRDGLYVNVQLPYKKDENAILVNNTSIGTNQSGNYLYVLSDKDSAGIYTVLFKHVTLGPLIDDTLRVVTSGINAHDMYVNKALLKVRAGSKVQIAK